MACRACFLKFDFGLHNRILAHGEIILMDVFPAMGFELLNKLRYLSIYLIVPLFVQLVFGPEAEVTVIDDQVEPVGPVRCWPRPEGTRFSIDSGSDC